MCCYWLVLCSKGYFGDNSQISVSKVLQPFGTLKNQRQIYATAFLMTSWWNYSFVFSLRECLCNIVTYHPTLPRSNEVFLGNCSKWEPKSFVNCCLTQWILQLCSTWDTILKTQSSWNALRTGTVCPLIRFPSWFKELKQINDHPSPVRVH